MSRFVVRRVIHGFIVAVAVTTVVFVVTRLVGDPVAIMLPLDATPEQRAAFETSLGLDQPIAVQYLDYLGDLARFDLGESAWQRRSAFAIVLEHLPLTFLLVGAAMALAIVIAVPLGVVGGMRPGSVFDKVAVTSSLLGLSIPGFWLGLMLILLFGVQLGWLPTSGAGSLKHLVLPAITLAVPAAGRIAMIVRVTMLEEIHRPWIKTARAKGIPTYRTIGLHTLRNAAVPITTIIGWETIRAMSGYAVIVEAVFAWPGVGFLAYQTVSRQDLMLLQAVVLVIAVLVVVVNVINDIVYKAIDPRIEVA